MSQNSTVCKNCGAVADLEGATGQRKLLGYCVACYGSDSFTRADQPEAPPQPIFVRVEGVTDAERYLGTLCDRTFLSLWSHQGVYKSQGMKGGKGHGKEICDLLVVFEDHVIIFSDKDCVFPNTGNLEL